MNAIRRMGVFAALAIMVGSLPAIVLGQGGNAAVNGRVTDANGLAVAGAKIEIVNVGTNASVPVTTNDSGLYNVPTLTPGTYRMTVEKEGFQQVVKPGLELHVADSLAINFTLQVGSVSQSVTVSGEAPLVDTTSGSLGSLVDDKKVADLPLNGRNYIDLTLLQPGITQHRNLAASPSSGGMWYSSNGAPVHSNNYLLDGAPLASMQGINSASASGATLGVDGIREYRIITNAFSAEYGMTMGSQVVMVSKGGTNRWTGDVFEYLRNSSLDARNYFDVPNAGGRRLPQFQRNNFGGSIGGPVIKDKTFFYLVYEGLRQRQGLSIVDNVLGAGCHGPAGAVITSVACPQLGVGAPSVTISAPIAPLLAVYPLPNLGTAAVPQFTYPFTAPTRDDYGQIRVDHTFSASDNFFARYTFDDAMQISSVIANTGPYSYPGFTMTPRSRSQYITLSESHVFSPTVLNTARFSFSRTTPKLDSHSTFVGPQYGFVAGSGTTELGTINIGGVSPLGPFTTAFSYLPQNVFNWSDDVFYSHGRHSFKFGVLINHFQDQDNAVRNTRGTVNFGNIASFLQGIPQLYTAFTPGSIGSRNYRFNTIGMYGQDDYRVTARLTLNLGLRYEFMTQLKEKNGLSSSLVNLQTDAAPTVGILFKNPTKHNVSPRVGFAWDIFGDGKTALRGGFGLLYDLSPYGTALDVLQPNNKPFGSNSTRAFPAGTPANSFTVPFNFSGLTPDYAEIDYNLKQQHLLSYNLAIERQFPFSIGLSVAYAGSRGINIFGRRDGNPTVPQGVPSADGNSCVARTAAQPVNLSNFVHGFATACWLTPATANPYINPNFGSVLMQTGAASSSYNALQVLLTKRLSHSLQFQTSYTFAKMMDDPQSDAPNELNNAPVYPVDAFHNNVDYALSSYDVKHNLRMNATYQLPHMSATTGFLPLLVNGWQASTILSLQGGYPFTVNLSTNRSNSRALSSAPNLDRPDLAPGRTAANITSGVSTSNGIDPCPTAGQKLGTPGLWFDPCAFLIQPAGFLGNSPRNFLRGPKLANLDMSMIKNTAVRALGENGRVEFRAEVFNILNHANFAMPGNRSAYAGNANVQSPLPDAGVISTTGSATSRQIQLALKVVF